MFVGTQGLLIDTKEKLGEDLIFLALVLSLTKNVTSNGYFSSQPLSGLKNGAFIFSFA